jgi:hypothetical protein
LNVGYKASLIANIENRKMAGNNPDGPEDDGSGGQRQAAKEQDIAAAINSLKAKYETAQNQQSDHDSKVLLWTKRATKGVFFYAFLTFIITAISFWSGWNAQRAVDLSAINFIVDQRPYIWLSNVGAPQIFQNPDGKVQIVWTFFYLNYGKTPASNMTFEELIRLGDGPFKPTFGQMGPSISAPLPPNRTGDHATIASEPMSKEDAAKYFSLENGIVVAGTIKYSDAHGNNYETTFCVGKLRTGDIAYERPAENCHNEIK